MDSRAGRGERLAILGAGRTGWIRPAGPAEIDQAKAQGRWAPAYSGQGEASGTAANAAAESANPAAGESLAHQKSANPNPVV